MSMLAERKVKQKWSLNPRGKDWSEDSNKFGQKMLEKMGWSKGKGLGAKENGIVENVKLAYKNDSKGMGYKESNDQWTEHDSHFNALLQSLSGAAPPETDLKIASLEKKSQTSRVRVHYKKFTRGKDLSRCSEKDLANIFGKKTLNMKPQLVEEIEVETKTDSFSYNGGSMLDYFKKKLPNFGKGSGYVVGSNGVLKKGSDSEEEPRVGFGFDNKRKANGDVPNGSPKKRKIEGVANFGFDPLFNNIVVQNHVLNTIEEEKNEDMQEANGLRGCEEATSRKKKKFIEESINGENGEVSRKKKKKAAKHLDSNQEATDDFPEALSAVKKKKKKKVEVAAIANPSFDENEGPDAHQNDQFEVKRKTKHKPEVAVDEVKRKEEVEVKFDNPSFDITDPKSDFVNDTFEIKRKKKKGKKVQGIENPNFDNLSNGVVSEGDYKNGLEEDKSETGLEEVGKKKKKKHFEGTQDPTNNCSPFEVKRKKKSIEKVQEIETTNFDNPSFDIADSKDDFSNNTFEIKRKKKKGEQFQGIENPNFDSLSDKNNYVDGNFEVKRKKKKKKDDSAVDNPTFEDSLNSSQLNKIENTENGLEEPCFDLILNITNTPPAPKPPKKLSSVKRRKSVRFSDVNEERIIPNKEDLENRNELFDINSRVIENGLRDSTNVDLDDISKKLDGCQAEVENDINEAKDTKYIGEVGNPDGENERLPGGTKLKFKFAQFGKTPVWANKNTSKARTSYKHLIKGDIVLNFNNTNLHEIVGYGVNKSK